MKVVGLTGGIGSGKSTVAQMFRSLGVPVYDSDYEAKRLMTDSRKVRDQIVELLGDEAYVDGNLNRPYIAQVVFNSPEKLKELNEIVHPIVKEDFQDWITRQDTPYVIQETALIFENGAESNYDAIVLITAPLKLRLQRVIARDKVDEEDVMRRVQNQMEDDEKMERAHFTIENLDLETTRDKVGEIHQELVKNDVNHQF